MLAYNEATSETGYYPVTDVWVHEDPITVYLTIDGEVIETTPEHPFYTEEGEWVPAGELEVGDEIQQADGSTGEVQSVEVVVEAQPMYNFTVDEAHTYFVGEGQWLVFWKILGSRVQVVHTSMNVRRGGAGASHRANRPYFDGFG